MLPDDMRAPSRPASFTDLRALHKTRKGKQRDTSTTPPSIENQKAPKAWWLDVSSPTWEDMRAIGKLLHLHPLTLEDILQQDPREKLELFSRLGYYFVVFRAIESQTTRERFQPREGEHDENPGGQGLVGEANVYLVVFREGICTVVSLY
jgi:magnesium transporter